MQSEIFKSSLPANESRNSSPPKLSRLTDSEYDIAFANYPAIVLDGGNYRTRTPVDENGLVYPNRSHGLANAPRIDEIYLVRRWLSPALGVANEEFRWVRCQPLKHLFEDVTKKVDCERGFVSPGAFYVGAYDLGIALQICKSPSHNDLDMRVPKSWVESLHKKFFTE